MANIQEATEPQSWSGKLKKGVTEIVSVIVGILLALAINEWWEDKEIEDRTRILTKNLNAEIVYNLEQLSKAHLHHQSHLEIIRGAYGENESLTKAAAQEAFKKLYGVGIFKRARLTDVNWEIAKFTGLMSYMPIEDLRHYAALFAVQELHEHHWKQLDQSMVIAEFETANYESRIRFLDGILSDTWWIERNLKAEMEKTLTALNVTKEEDQNEKAS